MPGYCCHSYSFMEIQGVKGVIKLNVSDVFDWAFFWSMFRNFVATAAPFVMIVVAIFAMGLLLQMIIKAVKTKGS